MLIAPNSGQSSHNLKDHGNCRPWKDTSQAPQAVRNRTVPEPKTIKVTEYMNPQSQTWEPNAQDNGRAETFSTRTAQTSEAYRGQSAEENFADPKSRSGTIQCFKLEQKPSLESWCTFLEGMCPAASLRDSHHCLQDPQLEL
jgi:hypothetical protein